MREDRILARRSLSFCLPLFLLALTACAPTRLLQNSPTWPQTWADRTLFTTPTARIYARTEAAAGEIDRLLASARRDFERTCRSIEDGRAAHGDPDSSQSNAAMDTLVPDGENTAADTLLVIVCGRDDLPLGPELLQLLAASARREAAWRADPAEEAAVDQALADARNATDEAGVDLSVMVGMMPLFCDAATLRDTLAAVPPIPDETSAALILPTRARIDRSAHELLHGTLANRGIGPIARVALAPLLLSAEAQMAHMLAVSREVAAYELLVYSHPSWPVAEKNRLVDEYAGRRLGAWNMRQPTSRPANPSRDRESEPRP